MKKNTKKTLVITLIILLFCVLMALTDGVFKANYLKKSIVKIVLFLILPVVYSFYDNEVKIKQMFIPDKKGLRFAISLGLLIYVVILGGYHLLKACLIFPRLQEHSPKMPELQKRILCLFLYTFLLLIHFWRSFSSEDLLLLR